MERPEAFQRSGIYGHPQMCEIVVEHDAMLKLRISGHNVRDSRSSPGLRQHATPGPSIRGDPPGHTRSNVFCFQQQHSAWIFSNHCCRGEALLTFRSLLAQRRISGDIRPEYGRLLPRTMWPCCDATWRPTATGTESLGPRC